MTEIVEGNRTDAPGMSNAGWLLGLCEQALAASGRDREAALATMKVARPISLASRDNFTPDDIVDPVVLARAWELWQSLTGSKK